MNILSLDLGSNTGWAALKNDKLSSGTLKLPNDKGKRASFYLDFLSNAIGSQLYDVVAYESVATHAVRRKNGLMMQSLPAAHLYGFFENALYAACHNAKVRVLPLNVATVKQHIGGNVHAKKEVIMARIKHITSIQAATDHEADALAILITAESVLKNERLLTEYNRK